MLCYISLLHMLLLLHFSIACVIIIVWCEGDCRTENDLQLYQLSNGGRTATKVFPESSRILRSKEPSCQSGQQITFWVTYLFEGYHLEYHLIDNVLNIYLQSNSFHA